MTPPRYALRLKILEVPPPAAEDQTLRPLTSGVPEVITGYNIDDCRRKARAAVPAGRIVRGLSINPDPRDPKKPVSITVVVYGAKRTKDPRTMKGSRQRYPGG